jgi:hypothetical protein
LQHTRYAKTDSLATQVFSAIISLTHKLALTALGVNRYVALTNSHGYYRNIWLGDLGRYEVIMITYPLLLFTTPLTAGCEIPNTVAMLYWE